MNTKNITDCLDIINNLIENINDWGKLKNDTDKSNMVQLVCRMEELGKKIKEQLRLDLTAGLTIPGAALGKDTMQASVSNWSEIKNYMIKNYNSKHEDLDKMATITISNLYLLDRTESGNAKKKDTDIKKLYEKQISYSKRQGSLKLN